MNQLEKIILQKKLEIQRLQMTLQQSPEHPIAKILRGESELRTCNNFQAALRQKTLAIIAEIKRKSPSKGVLAAIVDPISLARSYVESGANAISILTDELFFNGKIADLTDVAVNFNHHATPLLRKDFIIDNIQVAEAFHAGADAILAIVAVLGDRTRDIIEYAHSLNLQVLVEVHHVTELKIALDSGAKIIGINNRDLTTLVVDTEHAFQLLTHIPKDIIRVAESGILKPELAKAYFHAGFDAVLIGEALVKSSDPAAFIKACKYD